MQLVKGDNSNDFEVTEPLSEQRESCLGRGRSYSVLFSEFVTEWS